MSAVAGDAGVVFDVETDVLVIGAGAAGMIAALAARAGGADVMIVERDPVPRGSTALSAGLIPAADTMFQRRQGIKDGVGQFRADIRVKSAGTSDPVALETATAAVAPAIDWLGEKYGFAFEVITDFRYPGHCAARMHALARRTGAELIDALRAAVEREGLTLLTSSRATTLYRAADGSITGVAVDRGGTTERIGCRALVLACNGYGGNRAMVAAHLPTMKDALWFGHSGNDGDAVRWGEALGARLEHMSGHQGHGSVATPHGILITWATMTEGGCQVNARGQRFSNEGHGYSEQGEVVLRQPGGVAWSIFDERIAGIARQFEDFRNAEAQGAVRCADTFADLARDIGLPVAAFEATMAAFENRKAAWWNTDQFGRSLARAKPLSPPYCAVKVTGALFHTQGGLAIDRSTRVVRTDGSAIANLFAAGGAAVGVSGPEASGYLSGNGLLTAVGLGHVAGTAAAQVVCSAKNRQPFRST